MRTPCRAAFFPIQTLIILQTFQHPWNVRLLCQWTEFQPNFLTLFVSRILFVCLSFFKMFGWIELGPNSHAQIIWKYGLLPAPQYSFLQSDGIKNRIHNHKGCTWRAAVILHATQIFCIFWWCGCFGFNCTGRLYYFSGFTWLFQPFITVSFLRQWLNDPEGGGGGGGGVLPYRSYIGMCRPIASGFSAVLVWKRV